MGVDGPDHALRAALAARAEEGAGREVCGFVVEDREGRLSVFPVANVADRPAEAFRIDPAAHLALARRLRREGGRIAAVYHSHVDGPARLSEADLCGALEDGRPLLPGVDQVVVGMRRGKASEIKVFAWDGARFREAAVVAQRVAAVAPGEKSQPS